MRIRIRKLTSLLLSLSLLSALTLPAAASAAMGEDLTAKDTLIHRETQLSTNVFWRRIPICGRKISLPTRPIRR